MPNYDYLCKKCDYKFEHFQSFTARLLKVCPNCKKKSLVRLIGAGVIPIVDHPRNSYSLAVLPNQFEEAKSIYPDGTEWKYKNGCFTPVVKNLRHKNQLMKSRDFVPLEPKKFIGYETEKNKKMS